MRKCQKCGAKYPDDVIYCKTDGTQLSELDAVAHEGEGEGIQRQGTILGSYRLLKLLGEGGMGFVYLAEHTRLGRKVALKMLRSEYSLNPAAIKRFFREARAVNQINHENIVEITDFIEEEGRDNYYIMELLKGQSLDDVLIREEKLPTARILSLSTQICSALSTAHEAGIIHRDMKPENVFLIERSGQRDFVKLLDFGVAKLVDTGDAKPLDQTAAGAILGTPEYMSPEQSSGKKVDYRSDIYSLGVIMYEMVTGKKPLTAKSYGEMVIKLLTIVPPRPAKLKDLDLDIPKDLENLIMQCLEKEPGKRPQSMKEVENRLRKIGTDGSVELESFSAGHSKSNSRTGLYATGAVLIVIVGAVLGFTFMKSSTQPAYQEQHKPDLLAPSDQVAESKPGPVAQIEIVLDSNPQGAQVFRAGTEKPLGLTPVSLTVDRSEQPESFEFRLRGHQTIRREISLQTSKRFMESLPELVEAKPDPAQLASRTKGRKDQATPGSRKNGKNGKNGKGGKKVVKKHVPMDPGATIDPFAN